MSQALYSGLTSVRTAQRPCDGAGRAIGWLWITRHKTTTQALSGKIRTTPFETRWLHSSPVPPKRN